MNMTRENSVIFCGAFPPPVNGLANVNQAVFQLLIDAGLTVDKVDIAAKGGVIKRLWHRLVMLALTIRLVIRSGLVRTLYYALSSGFGQYFDLVAIVVARCAGARVVIHHHNFSYLAVPTLSSRCLFALLSHCHTVHVCLCDAMADLLRKTYGVHHEVMTLGNAAFIAPDHKSRSADGALVRKLKVGFLGALTHDKGIHDFLDLAEAVASDATDSVDFIVAGNAPESDALARLQALAMHGVVDFRGALYGEAKRDYLRSLDVFIFPSRYRHEAQPLVVFEALAAGVAVISYPIACMCDLDGMAGVSLAEEGQLEMLLREASTMGQAVRQAQARAIASGYLALHTAQRTDLEHTFLALFA